MYLINTIIYIEFLKLQHNMAKYKLTDETKIVNGITLHRIVATKNFDNVKVGDKGGFVESIRNLSDSFNSWISDNACVFGNAYVLENAQVSGNAMVYGNARVAGSATVTCNAQVYDNAKVIGSAYIAGNAKLFESAVLVSNAILHGNACVKGNAFVGENVVVEGNAKIYGNATINDILNYRTRNVNEPVYITDNAEIGGETYISSHNENPIYIHNNVKVIGDVTLSSEYGPIKLYNKTIIFGKCRLSGRQSIFGNSYICSNSGFRTYKVKNLVYLTYIRSTNMYCVDYTGRRSNFYGTEEQLIAAVKKHAKLDLHIYKNIINDVKSRYKLKYINID